MTRGGNGRDQKAGGAPAEASSDTDVAPAEGAIASETAGEDGSEPDALRAEVARLKDALLRVGADFENFRKRVERERQQVAGDTAAELFRELIPILDNFDRALAAGGSGESLRSGVELIARQMRGFLESRGIVVEEPVGEPFDPRRHEAFSHEESAEHDDGAVIEVFQKGYALRDRLLRPALVKVAKNHRPSDGDEDKASLVGREPTNDTPWGA